MKTKTNKRLGTDFEERVLRAFQRNGYVPIRKNQWKRNYDFQSDNAKKREYDLVFFNPAEKVVYIIECKAHFEKTTLTGLEEVVEFSNKLKNYNGIHARAVMVTDNDYTKPARNHALENRIILMDGQSLAVFESDGSYTKSIKSRTYSAVLGKAEVMLDRVIASYF